MKVVDFDGAILDATFSVLALEDGGISLDYEYFTDLENQSPLTVWKSV